MAATCGPPAVARALLLRSGPHGPLRMKILLTNHDLSYYAGTETFVYTLAVELQRTGPERVRLSPRLGAVAQRLVTAGVTVTADLGRAPDDGGGIHAPHPSEPVHARARD